MTARASTRAAEPATKRKVYKRRAEIIDAAAQVFAELGYHAASTQAIADVLNMRQASLYYYFPSKEQALYEVCLIGVQGFLEGFEEICGCDAGLPDKVRAGILNHMMPLRDRHAYVRVFLRDRHLISGPNRNTIGRVVRTYERRWQDLIEKGQAAGLFHRHLDPRTTIYGIIGMCNAAAAWVDHRAPGEIERVSGMFADMVLGGLKDTGTAPARD